MGIGWRLMFTAIADSNVRARHWRPIGQVWIAASAFDLRFTGAGDLLAFILLGLGGLEGFLGAHRFCWYSWKRGLFRRFAACTFFLAWRHNGCGVSLGHGDHVGTLYANLLQVFLVGLGVVVQVFGGFAVDRNDQVIGFLQARDDFRQALAAFGVVDGLGFAISHQLGECALVALLGRPGVRGAAVDVRGAFVHVSRIRGNALVVIGDLLLTLGVVTRCAASQGTARGTDCGEAGDVAQPVNTVLKPAAISSK